MFGVVAWLRGCLCSCVLVLLWFGCTGACQHAGERAGEGDAGDKHKFPAGLLACCKKFTEGLVKILLGSSNAQTVNCNCELRTAQQQANTAKQPNQPKPNSQPPNQTKPNKTKPRTSQRVIYLLFNTSAVLPGKAQVRQQSIAK
jgi:hypothetical protein